MPGFIPRWLLLEPIPANGLTDTIVQAAVKKEYFPDQFTAVPKDGDKVTVGDKELTCMRWIQELQCQPLPLCARLG